jgi:hypothetical protein
VAGDRSGAGLVAVDAEILRFVAAHRLIEERHVARLLAIDDQTARAHLSALAAGGLLARGDVLHGRPAFFQITAGGLRAINSQLPVPRFETIHDYRRDTGLPYITILARSGGYGEASMIMTEREMRVADRLAGTLQSATRSTFGFPIPADDPAARPELHYPDLVLALTAGYAAFNVQLTLPGSRRLASIISGYRIHPTIRAVAFLVDDPTVADHIEREAERLGMPDPVSVQPFTKGRYQVPAFAQ